MAEDEPAVTAGGADAVRPYKIHVPSKYLELTAQKLRLTRLPHERSGARPSEWWEPKSVVEPLIDFWLERYSWRDQEQSFNRLPQFRTAIPLPQAAPDTAPIRLHFLHFRSPRAHAVPLLLVPPFPFSALSLAHLQRHFTEPDHDGQDNSLEQQAFHLVIPSLPGLAFSDPYPDGTPVVSTTAYFLDVLMARLDYARYLATNAGSGASSPSRIDWKLVDRLATRHPDSCLGAHLVAPPLDEPRLSHAPAEWTRWTVARLTGAPVLGYQSDDLAALRRAAVPRPAMEIGSQRGDEADPAELTSKRHAAARHGLSSLGRLPDANTLAYALCDSPTGLLAFALKGLRALGQSSTRAPHFSPADIITLAQLAWISGPEYVLRWWSSAGREEDVPFADAARRKRWTCPWLSNSAVLNLVRSNQPPKAKVAITVFLGRSSDEADDAAPASEPPVRDTPGQAPNPTAITAQSPAPASAANPSSAAAQSRSPATAPNPSSTTNRPPAPASSTPGDQSDAMPSLAMLRPENSAPDRYACPGWGRTRYHVLHTQHAPGKAGLLAWERPEVIAAGARGLAGRMLATGVVLPGALRRPPTDAPPTTVPLQQVVVQVEGASSEETSPASSADRPKPTVLRDSGLGTSGGSSSVTATNQRDQSQSQSRSRSRSQLHPQQPSKQDSSSREPSPQQPPQPSESRYPSPQSLPQQEPATQQESALQKQHQLQPEEQRQQGPGPQGGSETSGDVASVRTVVEAPLGASRRPRS